MTPRITNTWDLGPAAVKAAVALEGAIRNSGLEQRLLELVKMRASQINGCAFCLAMHSTDAKKHGETEMRLTLLPAWRESTLYSDRERAALAWTEALTLIADTRAPDEVWDLVKAQFSDADIVHLTLQIGTINMWNRLQVSLRALPQGEVTAHAA
ncbi:MAG: carboxymuconolactone decarboxylase family protein [Geminicoccaceae bacterium]